MFENFKRVVEDCTTMRCLGMETDWPIGGSTGKHTRVVDLDVDIGADAVDYK